MTITHIFFDIGGVLGTNGWDREQRATAAAHFGLEDECDVRHHEVVGDWEVGALTTNQYLASTIFFRPREFTPAEFFAWMCEQSRPFDETIGIARALKAAGGVRLMTLNNESADLNRYRIERFGLREIFSAFLSSCWLGARKPSPRMFDRALGIAQARADESLFIDDREQNLAPARELGMQGLLYRDVATLRTELAGRGFPATTQH
ncbi:MAG TPA: HAD-IA family hydrolase [Gemmatimonadaceae bacterium]|nr:HAD-IA family hydrolase [Gemmatimonadaceae bacterium]